MSISTRKGDSGTTALAHNRRVSKTHPRVEAYGTVDELGAFLGVARATAKDPRLCEILHDIQADLLRLGAALAVDDEDRERIRNPVHIVDADVARLDAHVDELEKRLPPMRKFLLPGESLLSAHLHVARTVCRRAERRVVDLAEAGAQIDPPALKYLNRLSDLLWLLGRDAESATD